MKSFISYYLALCLCSGKQFLYQKTKKVNVGYFDWENPISDIQNRVLGMCKGMGFKELELDNLYFLNYEIFKMNFNFTNKKYTYTYYFLHP